MAPHTWRRFLGIDFVSPRHLVTAFPSKLRVSSPCWVECNPSWAFTGARLWAPSLTWVSIPTYPFLLSRSVSPHLQTALISVGCDLEKKIVIQK